MSEFGALQDEHLLKDYIFPHLFTHDHDSLLTMREVNKTWKKIIDQEKFEDLVYKRKAKGLENSRRLYVPNELPKNVDSWKKFYGQLSEIPEYDSDRERIRDAFSALRYMGFETHMSHTCCQTLDGQGCVKIILEVFYFSIFKTMFLLIKKLIISRNKCVWPGRVIVN